MADGVENIVYAVKAEGTQETSARFKELSGGLEKNQLIANNLSQALKVLGREAQVESRVVERASKQQEAAAKQLAAEQKRAAREVELAQRQVVRSLNDATRAAQAQALGVSKLTIFGQKAAFTLGAIATSAQNASPALNGFGAAVSRASGIIGGLSSLAGGPWAIAIGALTAGIGIAATAWKNFGDEQETVREKTVRLNFTLAQSLALMQKTEAARLQKTLVAQGLAGPEVQLAEVRKLEEVLKRINLRAGQNLRDPDIDTAGRTQVAKVIEGYRVRTEAKLKVARANYEGALKEQAAIEQEETDFEGALQRQLDREKKRNQKPNPPLLGGPSDRQQWEMEQAGEGYYSDARSVSEESRRALDKFKRDEEEKRKRTFVGREGENDALRRSIESHISDEEKMYKRKDELAKAHNRLLVEGAHEAWTMVGASAGQVFAQIAAGAKVSGAQVLAALGQQLIAAGTGHIFEGLFWELMPGTQVNGAAMIGIGAAEAAFGATLAVGGGGASRGAGASAGGADGGGGAASPTYSPSRSEDRTGDRFELHFHSVEKPTDDDMVRLYRGFQQAARNGRIPRMAEAR